MKMRSTSHNTNSEPSIRPNHRILNNLGRTGKFFGSGIQTGYSATERNLQSFSVSPESSFDRVLVGNDEKLRTRGLGFYKTLSKIETPGSNFTKEQMVEESNLMRLIEDTEGLSYFDGSESEDSIEVEGVQSKIIDIFELAEDVGEISKLKSHYFNCDLGPPSI